MATTVTLKPNAIDISGSTSGTTTLQATAVAGTTTLTLPAATDTLVGKATTDTLTNKTLTGAVMNGTVGATTPAAGAFTTLTAAGVITNNFPSSSGNIVALNNTAGEKFVVAGDGGGIFFGTEAASTHTSLRVIAADSVVSTFSTAGLAITGLTDISAATSGQIKFPATQNASANSNTLDDYEEGTWTPTITRSGTAPTVTYTAQVGFYTKIGNTVTCTVALGWSANTGGSGYWYVASLPFTSKNSANCVASSAIGDYTGFTLAVGTTQLGLEINNNVTYGVFQCSGSAVSSTVINTVAATGGISLSFTYFTA
jgi:hypothetical protein